MVMVANAIMCLGVLAVIGAVFSRDRSRARLAFWLSAGGLLVAGLVVLALA